MKKEPPIGFKLTPLSPDRKGKEAEMVRQTEVMAERPRTVYESPGRNGVSISLSPYKKRADLGKHCALSLTARWWLVVR